MPAATGVSSPCMYTIIRAFMGRMDLRCPKIEAQTILARHGGGRAAMEHKCVFVSVCQVPFRRYQSAPSHALGKTRPYCNALRIPFRLGTGGRHEAPLTGGRGTVGYSFKGVHTVPLKPAIFPAVVSATVAASEATTVLPPQGTAADSGFDEDSASISLGAMTEPASPAQRLPCHPMSARRFLEKSVKVSLDIFRRDCLANCPTVFYPFCHLIDSAGLPGSILTESDGRV